MKIWLQIALFAPVLLPLPAGFFPKSPRAGNDRQQETCTRILVQEAEGAFLGIETFGLYARRISRKS